MLVLYQFIAISIDLKICTKSKAMKSNMIWSTVLRILSGKQLDHRSPWSPSWLTAGIDECCKSANECGRYGLKIVGCQRFDTRPVKWTADAKFSTISCCAIVRMQKQHCFYSQNRKHSGWQWLVEAVAGAVSLAISGSHSNDSMRLKDTINVNIKKNTILTDTIPTMICTRFIRVLSRNRSYDNPFLAYNRPFQLSISSSRFPCLWAWPQCTCRWVHSKDSWKL